MVDRVEADSDVCTFVVRGEVGPSELLTAYATFLESDRSPFTLIDLTAAKLPRIDADAMRDLVKRLAEIGRRCRKAGRAAIVCRCNPDYGMARTFITEMSVERQPVRFAVFSGRESAQPWLRGVRGDVLGAGGCHAS